MKEQIETQLFIDAPISKVWNVLSDFMSYPQWSPTIRSFDGIPSVGRRTKVQLQQPGGTSIRMNPLFLTITENTELRWRGSLWIEYIFNGEHYFVLEAVSPEVTKLVQGEMFSGILVPFLKKMIYGNTLAGFNLFNTALKERVESLD